MKKRKVIIMLFFSMLGLLTIGSQQANARGVLVWGTSEKIVKIADLPDSAMFQTSDGENFDIGAKYTVFHIFWLPIWVTKDAEACGYIDKSSYVELTDEDLEACSKVVNTDFTEKIKPKFWDRFGGKAILLVIIAFAIWGAFSKDDKEKEEEKPADNKNIQE